MFVWRVLLTIVGFYNCVQAHTMSFDFFLLASTRSCGNISQNHS